jgi:uncharacterized protein (TIGR00369 family)
LSTPTTNPTEPYAHVWTRIATGNPAWALLGIRLRELQPGHSFLDLSFRPEILNPWGSVHGGIVTSLADAAGACALYTLVSPDRRLSSIELKVNFFKPLNGDARAEGRVLHQGSRTGVSYVEVRSPTEVVAVALLTFAILG